MQPNTCTDGRLLGPCFKTGSGGPLKRRQLVSVSLVPNGERERRDAWPKPRAGNNVPAEPTRQATYALSGSIRTTRSMNLQKAMRLYLFRGHPDSTGRRGCKPTRALSDIIMFTSRIDGLVTLRAVKNAKTDSSKHCCSKLQSLPSLLPLNNFKFSFHSRFQVLFIFPSRYLCAISFHARI